MNVEEIISESLLTPGMRAEKVPAGKEYLLLLDIDNTLVTPKNIYIWRKLPTDKKRVRLTPSEYANEKLTPETRSYYDYSEFKDEKKAIKSIVRGEPLWRNLRVMDHHIKRGWKIGILTARQMEDLIYKSLKKWLKYRPEPGKGKGVGTSGLKKIGKLLTRSLVHAVGDKAKAYEGTIGFEKKANLIKKLAKKYDMVKIIDDDDKNIRGIRELNISNVVAVKALPKSTM